MKEHLRFDIPERFPNVTSWFSENLVRLDGVELRGTPTLELCTEGLQKRHVDGPDSKTVIWEIVMQGFRTKGAPIPSDWAPYLIEGWEAVWEPLGKVMEFQFHSHGGQTRVWARCEERLANVQSAFEDLLAQIEKCYPTVGPLVQDYRTKYEQQQLDLAESYLKMESSNAGHVGVTSSAEEPETRMADTRAEIQSQQTDETTANAKERRKLPGKPGRKRLEANEWARRMVHTEGEDQWKIYPEWCKRYTAETGRRITELADSKETFKKVLKQKPK